MYALKNTYKNTATLLTKLGNSKRDNIIISRFLHYIIHCFENIFLYLLYFQPIITRMLSLVIDLLRTLYIPSPLMPMLAKS